MRNLQLLIVILLVWLPAQAQQTNKPIGTFSTDTVKLGALFHYLLVHQHPSEQEIILPGTNYNFFPFELVRKEYFPTRTKGGISTDSAIYTLRTFDTKPEQGLALPVFLLQDIDTISIFADSSHVIVRQMVTKVKEPLRFQSNTELVPVEERFNWPVLLLWVVAGSVVSALIWLLFGQALKIKYKLYRLRKDHLYFASRYNAHVDRFVKSGYEQSLEKAVSLWKNYLTKLERSAINSFTTKEIVEFYDNDEEVNNALRHCDKAIYGNVLTEADAETREALLMLRRFAKIRYKAQREIIKNAKNKRKHAGMAEPGVV